MCRLRIGEGKEGNAFGRGEEETRLCESKAGKRLRLAASDRCWTYAGDVG